MTAIDYSSGTRLAPEGSHVVYTRAAWGDAWTAQPNMKCTECQWNAAPQQNTAVLRWDLGDVILPGDSSATTFGAWVGRGQFVRIDWTCDDASLLRWVGFVDSSEWPTEAFGSQQIVCYGLERALTLTPIADVVWRDEDAMGDPVVRRSAFPLTFNAADGKRSKDPLTTGGSVYGFADYHDTTAELWSTREIVRYLMTYHLPTNSYGVADVPWAVDQITQLPDWDSPTVETRNRTVWDILTELVAPSEQLGFTVGSDGSTAYLRCFTHLASTLTIGSRSITANPNQHTLVFAPDALTDGRLSDVGGGYDQVICRGARRKTICSLEHGTEIINGWEILHELTYESGASAYVGYSGDSDSEKRRRNATARGQAFLSEVYRRFKLDPDWNFEIAASPIFTDNENPHSIRILPRLPIKSDVEWDSTVAEEDFDRDGEGRPALVWWADPTGVQDFIPNDALEGLSYVLPDPPDLDFTVRPKFNEAREFDLIVDGGPQHLIADGEFSALAADDVDPVLDYRTIGITVAIEEDRFCEGVYPTTPASADIIRRLVVDLGEEYQQIEIIANTVTDISSGDKKLSSGGTLVDDSEKLAAIAQVIAQGALLSRKTVHWSSLRKISSVAVGDLITTASGSTVNAPVTAIHIRSQVGVNRPAGATRQSFETYRGSTDPLSILRRLGGLTDPVAALAQNTAKRPGGRTARRV